jgi:rhodanese-related sulfurtransferase
VDGRYEWDQDDKAAEEEVLWSQWGAYTSQQYPSESWIETCRKEFPDKGVATLEEARTLFAPEIGYVVLDVRSEYEVNSGKVPGATNIPLINVKTQWSSETNARSFDQTPNSAFMTQVAKKFPNKETKILIMCSDGMDRAIQALMALDGAGYADIVGVRQGYNGWINKFTNKLQRRRSDGYKEDYAGAGGNACGIHGTGIGFARMDAIDKVEIKDPTEWIKWKK